MNKIDFSKKVYVVESKHIGYDAYHFSRYKFFISESTWEDEINYFDTFDLYDNKEWKEVTIDDERYPLYEVKKDDNGTYSVWYLTYKEKYRDCYWSKEIDKRECLADGIATEEDAEHIKHLYYIKDRGECCSTNVGTLCETFETREEAVACIVDFIEVDDINEMLDTDYDEVTTEIVEQYLAKTSE